MLHNFINIAKWNELPKNYQSIVRVGLARRQYAGCRRATTPSIPAALKRLVAGGAQLRPFSQAIMDACLQGRERGLCRNLGHQSPTSRRSTTACVAFRGDQYLWWQVAEYGYDSFMIRTRTRDVNAENPRQ